MVSYRCVGYGITGNDGVATLDTNLDGTSMSHSYTGSGVGELDFVASVDSPTQINSSSDVSQPYTVTDCVYYDDSTNNTGLLVRMNKTASDGKSVITATGDNAHWIFKQNTTIFDLPFIVEFDISNISTTNSPCLNIHDASNHDYYVWFDENGHYKFSVSQSGITQLQGSATIDKSGTLPTSSNVRLSFLLRTTNDTITYDNLEIYPTS